MSHTLHVWGLHNNVGGMLQKYEKQTCISLSTSKLERRRSTASTLSDVIVTVSPQPHILPCFAGYLTYQHVNIRWNSPPLCQALRGAIPGRAGTLSPETRSSPCPTRSVSKQKWLTQDATYVHTPHNQNTVHDDAHPFKRT